MRQGLRVGTANQVVVRALTVVDVVDLSPVLRRVVFGGDDLRGVTTPDGRRLDAMRSTGFDDRLLVLLPEPGTGETVLPVQGPGRIESRSDGRVGVRRSYTVRRWDAESGALSLDFVLHGHGPAATWAARCTPGDRLHILGPGTSHSVPLGVDWLLLAGDETALPAIARWLEEAPADAVAEVFIEVDQPEHALDLIGPAGVSVTWLFRRGTPAAGSTLLAEAIASRPSRAGIGYAWVAGEAGVVRPIRRFLRNDLGLPRTQVEVAGYWRQGVSEDHEDHDEHHEEAADGPSHAVAEFEEALAGLAGILDRLDLLPAGSSVQVLPAEAEVVRSELAVLRPDLSLGSIPADVAVVYLDDEASAAAQAGVLADATDSMGEAGTLVVVVPPDVCLAIPDALTRRAQHHLDWFGTAVVLGTAR